MATESSTRQISLTVNGEVHSAEVEPRMLLSDFLRDRMDLTGTNVGCEHGVCGACTVLIAGRPSRSCLTFAVQADGQEVETVESLAADGELHPIQHAYHEMHGLQCGFCTPGFLMTTSALLAEDPDPDEDKIREYLSGNICRCTGYMGIVRSVRRASELLREDGR